MLANGNKSFNKVLFFLLSFWICSHMQGQASDKIRLTSHRKMMGTYVLIICYASSESVGNRAMSKAYDRAEALIKVYSDFDKDSEISQLNRTFEKPGVQPQAVSTDLMHVLFASRQMYEKSQHAFDPTVGPAVQLWRWARYHKRLPDQSKLNDARSLIGFDHIKIDQDQKTVQYLKPGIQLDLGGISKGAIVDAMLKVMSQEGVDAALIDAGGDMSCSNAPPYREGWRVSLLPFPSDQRKDGQSGQVRNKTIKIQIANAAVATSGDAYRFIIINGKRYSHILDPNTGFGLTKRVAVSVLVHRSPTVSDPAMLADALASSCSVLAVEKGKRLLKQFPKTQAVFMVMNDQEEIETFPTNGVSRYILKDS